MRRTVNLLIEGRKLMKSQKLEKTQVPISKWMDKQNVVYA